MKRKHIKRKVNDMCKIDIAIFIAFDKYKHLDTLFCDTKIMFMKDEDGTLNPYMATLYECWQAIRSHCKEYLS